MNTAKPCKIASNKQTHDINGVSNFTYVSKVPDANGYIDYSEEENGTWQILYERQMKIIQKRACDEFHEGLEKLKMDSHQVPQLPQINEKLHALTGWQVERVPALIGFERFFELLANRRFPAATFIRRRVDLDYIQEPDIFHELFGHCPLLTNPDYANFSQEYGKLGLAANKQERAMLARLYWFTIEFGLVRSKDGLKIYGGGILSSKEETLYALESELPLRSTLDVVEAFRTHYRIDELQKSYFIIDSLEMLQQIQSTDLKAAIKKAQQLGMKPSPYLPKENAAC